MKSRGYRIYSILTTLFWEAVLAVVVLRLLPKYGVDIPFWALIVLMALLGTYGYLGCWLGGSALDKRPLVSLEALFGTKCKTVTPLKPQGYVRIRGELWQAKSESDIDAGEEVTIVGVEGLTLLVRSSDDSRNGKTT